ncbi:MAG: AMP-binding protein [Bacteroidia bacterium]
MIISFETYHQEIEINESNFEILNSISINSENDKKVRTLLLKWFGNEKFVFKSSGSTGKPKEFTFTKEQVKLSAEASIEAFGLTQKDHLLLLMNADFVGAAMLVLRAAVLDAKLSVMPILSASTLGIETNHNYTFCSMVPLQMMESIKQDEEAIFKLKRFKKILLGGNSIFMKLEQLIKENGLNVYHSYGMTETLSHVAIRQIGHSSYFKTLRGTFIKLNEDQCICIKNSITNDWLETNDLAEMNTEGDIKIIGRKDFVINSGGIKYSPETIESRIHEFLEKQAIQWNELMIGWIQSEQWGQELILLIENQEIEEEVFNQLKIYLKQFPEKHAYPKSWKQIKSFKRTENGKLDRKNTIELAQNQ